MLVRSLLSLLGGLAGARELSVSWHGEGPSAFSVQLSDGQSINGLPVRVHANGQWYSSADGTLRPVGEGSATRQEWEAADGLRVATSIEQVSGGSGLIFATEWPDGAEGTSVGDPDAVASEFPALDFTELKHWGYFDYHGNQNNYPLAGQVGTLDVKRLNVDGGRPAEGAGVSPINRNQTVGGQEGGLMLFFDRQASQSLVLSPASSFPAANLQAKSGSSLAMGVMGMAERVPPGWSVSFILHYGDGISPNVQRWGATLRERYGRSDAARSGDMTNAHLGYNTDNGAYYYYETEKGKNYLQTLLDVHKEATRLKLPFRHVLIDSWWYPQDEHGGVTDWSPKLDVFEGGWADFDTLRDETGWKFTMHNRFWSSQSIYAKENGGNYTFVQEEKFAVPDDDAFWDYLFASRKEHGLYTYEQDWLITEYQYIDATRTDVELARRWLMRMGAAAERQDIWLQYCMTTPRLLLQSLEVPRVSQARASEDNIHIPISPNNVWIAVNAMVIDSLGMAPVKDLFLSNPIEDFHPKMYLHAGEPESRLHALVATLSTGPVTVGDRLGHFNTGLIMRSADAGGRLLRPSESLKPLDRYFTDVAFSHAVFLAPVRLTGAPCLQLARMNTEGHKADLLLGFHLTRTVEITPADMHLSEAGPLFAMQLDTSDSPDTEGAEDIQAFSSEHPVRMHPWYRGLDFHYWQVVRPIPEATPAWLLLGELGKWVPSSADRITSVNATANSLVVSVRGEAGEQVSLAFAELVGDGIGARATVTCDIGASGGAVFALHERRCADTSQNKLIV